jgi:hypothetical protein
MNSLDCAWRERVVFHAACRCLSHCIERVNAATGTHRFLAHVACRSGQLVPIRNGVCRGARLKPPRCFCSINGPQVVDAGTAHHSFGIPVARQRRNPGEKQQHPENRQCAGDYHPVFSAARHSTNQTPTGSNGFVRNGTDAWKKQVADRTFLVSRVFRFDIQAALPATANIVPILVLSNDGGRQLFEGRTRSRWLFPGQQIEKGFNVIGSAPQCRTELKLFLNRKLAKQSGKIFGRKVENRSGPTVTVENFAAENIVARSFVGNPLVLQLRGSVCAQKRFNWRGFIPVLRPRTQEPGAMSVPRAGVVANESIISVNGKRQKQKPTHEARSQDDDCHEHSFSRGHARSVRVRNRPRQ